jgi:Tol biopolymer transport system component
MRPRFCRIDPRTGVVTRAGLGAEDGMALSPLLDRVLFERDAEALVVDLEGGEPVRVLAAGEGESPRWTTAGDRIVYAARGASGMAFWTMRADGGDRRLLLQGVKGADPASVRLSPDGRDVFFAAAVEGEAGTADAVDLHVAPAGGGETRRLSNRHAHKRRYAVAPDGARIAYEVAREEKSAGGISKSEIWLMSRPAIQRRTKEAQ